ncbi:MAG: discoidin domain-containing protein [bacterium]|nr:discoidin domain-containing protein [Candidatus Sumerlaeota bacterium]
MKRRLYGLLSCFAACALAAAQPADLVTTHGRNFVHQGKVFRFVGVNIRGLSQYGKPVPLPYTSTGDIDTNINGAASMGVKVIRLFAPNSEYSTQDNIDRLRGVLDKMLLANMKAIVCMTDFYYNNYHPAGDDSFYTSQGGWQLLNDTWFKTGYTLNYLPWIRSVADQLKNHSAVFAWELGNELSDLQTQANIIPFARAAAAAIKAIDPHHMVTTGFLSIDHIQVGIDNGISLYSDPNIDFITVHTYNGQDPSANWNVASRVEKPLVVEEYGWSASSGDRVANTQAQVNKWYDTRLVSGFMQWGYQAGTYDIGDGDNDVGMDRYAHPDYNQLFSVYLTRANALAVNPPDPPPLGQPAGTNLARTAAGWQADSSLSSSFSPDRAIDGMLNTKWTSNGGAPPHWIALDLGAMKTINGFIIRMAGAGTEQVGYNFKSFVLQSGDSLSGSWNTITAPANPAQFAEFTTYTTPPINARCVRINVTQTGIDNYARLPEFEVYGAAGTNVADWSIY